MTTKDMLEWNEIVKRKTAASASKSQTGASS